MPSSTLTVESGTVKAYGGFQAAGIGGGEDSCGGTFIANGGTILARAGDECATGIGAGHGDYHEGTKKLYDRAKVTSSRSRTDSPDNVRPADQRLAGNGLALSHKDFQQHAVSIGLYVVGELIGRDGVEDLALLDRIPFFFLPFVDGAFGHGKAKLRH